jgi:hypothetical protein
MTILYRGDTMPLTVSWFLPDTENPFTENDASINGASVKVVRLRDNTKVIDNQPATISGNETIYVVPAEAIALDSEYAAFVTAVFNDDSTRTERIDFVVRAKR